MSGKLVRALRFDGLRETLSLVVDNIGNRTGLRPSNTFLFVNDSTEPVETGNIEYESFWLTDETQLRDFSILGRIDNDTAVKWLNDNHKMFVINDGKDIIAYGCVRFHKYKINENVEIMLDEDEAWLGPVFVNCGYRNRGINSFQIASIVRAERENGINRIFTGINSRNYPSIISYLKNGFKIIGFHHVRKGLFCKNIEKLVDFSDDQCLKSKLRSV